MENSPKTSQSIWLLPLSPSQLGNISISCSISSACHQAWYPFLFSSTRPLYPAHFIKAQLKYSELQIISAAEMPGIETVIFHLSPMERWGLQSKPLALLFLRMAGAQSNFLPYFFLSMAGAQSNPLALPLLRMAYALLFCFRLWASTCEYFWTGTERIQNLPPYRMNTSTEVVVVLGKLSDCTTLVSLHFSPVLPFLGKAIWDPSGRANRSHNVSSWKEHE